MKNNTATYRELKDLSPFVAAIGNQTPYALPPGYLEDFAVQLVLRIALEEKAGVDPVLNISKSVVFDTPEGYFEGFADRLLIRIKAQETENAGDELALLSPLLSKMDKKSPFTAPEGYFSDLSASIMTGVQEVAIVNADEADVSPMMQGLKEKRVYEVPAGYFENNPATIVSKVTEQPTGKLLSFGFGKKAMRYAAAAVVTGIIVVTGYVISTRPDMLHSVAASKSAPWDSARVAAIPDQEIEGFLNANTVSVADITTIDDHTVDEEDIKDLLADIPDEELQRYLEQHGAKLNSVNN
ncbi:MAG: hypothetical protein ABIU63_17475 [Chitinophagaceae bacterium]